MYGVTLWMPTIIKDASGLGDLGVGVVSALPYLAAAVFMVLVGASSDKSGERRFHVAGCLVIGAMGFALSCGASSAWGKVVCLVLAAMGIWGALGPFWALAGSFLSGTAAAAGIALVNSVGNLGGFAGPTMMGFLRDATGSYKGGLFLLGVIIFLGGMGAGMVKGKGPTDDRSLRSLGRPPLRGSDDGREKR
jgi:ACS family tartrate transporter-like MFS transporter